MSHVHAFLCIRTFLFLSFDIKNCLVLFWLSFSASLSLPLTLVYSMAPKHISTSTRNPLHSEESSSSSPSNPTPSHVRFRDEKAKSDFLENFSWRSIHFDCQVILSNFSDIDLHTVIHSRGWESLCGVPVMCPFVIIQEFYSNMHGFDYSIPQFSTCIRGMHMVVTSEIVSKVLHVPRVAHLDYLGCQHLKTMSKDELSSLFCETPSL